MTTAKAFDIFLDPRTLFLHQREHPTFFLPFLALVLAGCGLIAVYFLRVDPDWFLRASLEMSGREMTVSEMESALRVVPSTKTQGYISIAVTLMTLPLMYLMFAGYYVLMASLIGAGLRFRHALSLVTWSALPGLLGAIVGIVGAFLMEPQSHQHALLLTHVDPLFVQLPFDHDLSRIAKSFDLLHLWTIALGAIGWKTFTRSGWGSAVFVAALPSVLIYGIWLLIALL